MCLAEGERCFINITQGTVYLMSYGRILQAQTRCHPSVLLKYKRMKVTPNISLYHNDKGQIFVPRDLAETIIQWYHHALNHAGENKLKETYSVHFFTPKLSEITYEVCKACEICQKNNLSNHNYGLLPPRTVDMQPWHTVAVDLVGPWNLKVSNDNLESHALTIIDVDTNLAEIILIQDKTSRHITN